MSKLLTSAGHRTHLHADSWLSFSFLFFSFSFFFSKALVQKLNSYRTTLADDRLLLLTSEREQQAATKKKQLEDNNKKKKKKKGGSLASQLGLSGAFLAFQSCFVFSDDDDIAPLEK